MTERSSIIAGPTIQLAHHRIHEGRFFSVTAVATGLPAGVPKDYIIQSPPAAISIAHVIVIVNVAPGAIFELFEETIVSDKGKFLGSINQDRNNPVIATGFAFEDPIVTSTGTRIYADLIGSPTTGGTGGPRYRDEDEILFKPLTLHLLRTTPLSNNTILSIEMRAYRQAAI